MKEIQVISDENLKKYLGMELDSTKDFKITKITNKVNKQFTLWCGLDEETEKEITEELEYPAYMYSEFLLNQNPAISSYGDPIEKITYTSITNEKIPTFIYTQIEEWLLPKYRQAKGLVK